MLDIKNLRVGAWLKDKYGHYYKICEFSKDCVTMLCYEMYRVLDDWLEGDIIALSVGYVKNYTEVYNNGE